MTPCDRPISALPARHLRGVARLVALALGACGACGGPSRPLPDAPAPRVVSLAPALTAVVRELGGDAHLVGVTTFCDAPAKPVVGDLSPRPEAVMAQRPDVVLMAGYASQAATAASLRALGLEVRTLPLVTLADMAATTRAIARLLGREAAAEAALGAFERAVAAGALATATRPVRVLLVYDVQPGYVTTTGGGDHISELLARLGAENVAHGQVTMRMGLERVLEAAPELILHVAPDQRFGDDASALAHWSAWPSLPAVARAQVAVFPSDELARNGPHLARVVPRLAELLRRARP